MAYATPTRSLAHEEGPVAMALGGGRRSRVATQITLMAVEAGAEGRGLPSHVLGVDYPPGALEPRLFAAAHSSHAGFGCLSRPAADNMFVAVVR